MKNIFLILAVNLPFAFISKADAYEPVFTLGYQHHEATINYELLDRDFSDNGYYFGFSVRSAYGRDGKHLFGFGIDAMQIAGDRLIGYRALDYMYRVDNQWRLGVFFGAATLDSGLPQNGLYTGASVSRLNLIGNIDGMVSLNFGDGLARDRAFESDFIGMDNRPDIFLHFAAITTSLSWRF